MSDIKYLTCEQLLTIYKKHLVMQYKGTAGVLRKGLISEQTKNELTFKQSIREHKIQSIDFNLARMQNEGSVATRPDGRDTDEKVDSTRGA